MSNSKLKLNHDGTKYYINSKGQIHRKDGPAVIYPNGEMHWYKNDKRHRVDGPASVYCQGVIYENGDKSWWLNKNLIRIFEYD